MIEQLFRTKPLAPSDENNFQSLKRVLSGFDLTFLGIGAVIGAGIFVITGIAAATKAGPAIILSYLISGCACALTALSYAELASSIGGCGSAYGYAYAALGEFIAWIIGWDLILEYSFSVSTVSVGWSHYINNVFHVFGLVIPEYLLKSPFEGGYFNLPAVLGVLIIALLLIIGVRTSARANAIMVSIKILVITLFCVIAAKHFHFSNWQNFIPFGWQGIMSGAALIFFAYVGFDAVSTAAEEVIEPQRNLPIGIIASLIICTFIYILVSALLTGAMPYYSLNVSSPIAHALIEIGHPAAAVLVAFGAIAGLTTVMLVMYYGLSRVLLAMARDGLLPHVLAKVHPTSYSPTFAILLPGILIVLLAAFFPINELAELVNIGTLSAFVIVCVGVVVLRYTQPNLYRPFKVPFSPIVPIVGALMNLYLILSLPKITYIRFAVWMFLGILIYFFYSRIQSQLANKQSNVLC